MKGLPLSIPFYFDMGESNASSRHICILIENILYIKISILFWGEGF